MRVLLTGAAGFIGTRIGAQLSAAGHEVVGVDVMLPAAHGDGAQPPPDVRLLDVRDADAVAEALHGVDVVCHQAAVVGAGVNAADAPSYGSHNDFATTVLLAEMYAAGCRRLVLASSMVVYGQGRYGCPQHGIVDPVPRRRADLAASRAVLAAARARVRSALKLANKGVEFVFDSLELVSLRVNQLLGSLVLTI